MDKIIGFRRYICGYEEFDFQELYKKCDRAKSRLPVNVFLVEHKKYGVMLINTGCSRLMKHNAVSFARYLAKNAVSFSDEDAIDKQLEKEKLDPSVIKKVLLTHCDPQCCGGLKLLPQYELRSTAQVLTMAVLADPSDGIMPSLMPPLETPKAAAGIFQGKHFLADYFKWVFDVFGDGTVLAVDLSGHARSMAGFCLTEKNLFIAADASVDETALDQHLTPSPKLLKNQFYPKDYLSVLDTLCRIRHDHPELRIVFNHSEIIPEVI